jgi:hypothetical protein
MHLSALRQRSGAVRAAAATCWRFIVTLDRPHIAVAPPPRCAVNFGTLCWQHSLKVKVLRDSSSKC